VGPDARRDIVEEISVAEAAPMPHAFGMDLIHRPADRGDFGGGKKAPDYGIAIPPIIGVKTVAANQTIPYDAITPQGSGKTHATPSCTPRSHADYSVISPIAEML
jgi:hypothetical protein